MKTARLLFALLSALALACGGGTSTPDAGLQQDSGTQASGDGGQQGQPGDGGFDAGNEAPTDGGTDGGVQSASCSDGQKNGEESDVDCGGSACAPCGNALACGAHTDCQSGLCYAQACQASVHDCTTAGALDLTGEASVTVTFTNFSYTPGCIRVKTGTTVTFSGSFTQHPFQGGAVVGGQRYPDTSGPFANGVSAGTSADFTLTTAGTYPYYCVPHGPLGMVGVVFVEP